MTNVKSKGNSARITLKRKIEKLMEEPFKGFAREIYRLVRNEYPEILALTRKSRGHLDFEKLYGILGLPASKSCLTCGSPTQLYGGRLRDYCSHRCVGNSPYVADTKLSNCRIVHGVDHPSQLESTKRKYKAACQHSMGCDNPFKSAVALAKRVRTWKRTRGVSNPMQDASVFRGVMRSSFSNKLYTDRNGLDHECQGFEPLVLGFLDHHPDVVNFKALRDRPLSIPYFYQGKTRYYFPDLCARLSDGRRVLIEVKSKYTLHKDLARNKAKFKAAATACSNQNGWSFWLAVCEKGSVSWSRL